MGKKISEVLGSYKPVIHLTEEELPQLKDYDLGMKYIALYNCKVIGKHISDDGKVSGDLEIIDIKALPYASIKEALKGLKK